MTATKLEISLTGLHRSESLVGLLTAARAVVKNIAASSLLIASVDVNHPLAEKLDMKVNDIKVRQDQITFGLLYLTSIKKPGLGSPSRATTISRYFVLSGGFGSKPALFFAR